MTEEKPDALGRARDAMMNVRWAVLGAAATSVGLLGTFAAASGAGASLVGSGIVVVGGIVATAYATATTRSKIRDGFQEFIDREKDYASTLAEARQLERENPLAQKVQQAMAKISELSTSLTQEHEQNTSLTAQNAQLAERVRSLEMQLEVAQSERPVAPEVEARAQVTQSPSP